MKKFLFLIILIILTTTVAAQGPYHLKLLAVQETDEGFKGSDADLFLELKEGSGRVFLDTFPLTKMDTQISTRFAKEIACNHFELNCQDYDFIYTIKSGANIIGGPSAGAAIATLTTIAVLDLDYNKKVSITGTINSGGLIGPVGGVKEKLEAAKDSKLTKVLIAQGNNLGKNETDLVEYGKNNLSLDVIETLDLDEVLFHFTGKDLNHKERNFSINEDYSKIMKDLQTLLCKRTELIEEQFDKEGLPLNISKNIIKIKGKSKNASINNDHYSAASYCFGNNIALKKQYLKEKKLGLGHLKSRFSKLKEKTQELEEEIEKEKIETVSDLQSYMVVKERINDVKEQFKKFNRSEDLDDLYDLVGYSEERYFSALTWTQFFTMSGKKYKLDKKLLHNICLQKIQEAEQREQYASFFLPNHVQNIQEKIEQARTALNNDEPELCLITTAQAKGDANALLSIIGQKDEALPKLLEGKRKAVERVIFQNSQAGIFPILGYSYYQYANSLESQNEYTALVYLEYSLEMSNLQIYFPETKIIGKVSLQKIQLDDSVAFFIAGFIIGGSLVYFLRKKR